MLERLGYALIGAVLGGLTALLIMLAFLAKPSWPVIGAGAGVGAVFVALLGDRGIEALTGLVKEVDWW